MEYKLKPGQERFRVCDGPFANREYAPGVIYSEVPPQESGRFEEVRKPTVKKSKTAEVDNA